MMNPLFTKYMLLTIFILASQTTIKAMDVQKNLEELCMRLPYARPEDIKDTQRVIHKYLEQISSDEAQNIKQSLVEKLAPSLANLIWEYTYEGYEDAGYKRQIRYFNKSITPDEGILDYNPPGEGGENWNNLSFDQLLERYVERVQTAPNFKEDSSTILPE